MNDIRELLEKVRTGEITPEEAEAQLKIKPFVDLGFAKPDTHRGLRRQVAGTDKADRRCAYGSRPEDGHRDESRCGQSILP